MIKMTVNVDDVLALLNEARVLDPDALALLVGTRVWCNEALANHPTIQVSSSEACGDASCLCEDASLQTTLPDGISLERKKWRVGLIGILNGLFGTYEDGPEKTRGFGPITVHIDTDTGFIIEFRRTRSE